MSEDRDALDMPEAMTGFDEMEPEPTTRRQIGGARPSHEEGATNAPPQDALDSLLARPDTHITTRLIAQRLRDIEKHFPDAFKVGQSIVALNGRINELVPVVQHLSQQRAVAEVAMERQVRATAMDLAIKALPDDRKGDAAMISQLADAFLGWLKSGTQG